MKETGSNPAARLSAYTTAAAAFLLGANDAAAHVVYQDIDPDSLVTAGDTILLDIDGDGVNDLQFWIESVNGVVTSASGAIFNYTYRFAYASGLEANAIFGETGSNSGYEFNSAVNFLSGSAIEDTLPKFFDKARLSGIVLLDGIPFYSGGPWNGVNGMMGVRFKIGDETHFAWIRLDVATAANGMTISELAWDNQSDAGIVAGTVTGEEIMASDDRPQVWSFGNDLHVQTNSQNSQVMLEVFSLTGALVHQTSIPGGKTQTPLFNITPGFYVVRLTQNEQQWSSNLFLGSTTK
jgi:hypothetical protein